MKPRDVAANMQAAIDLLVQQRDEYLAAHPDATEPEQADEWPQVGDSYWVVCVDPQAVHVREVIYREDATDHTLFSMGEAFRTRAEAVRRYEAQKVQAELRRMPGRCTPPDDSEPKYCIDFDFDGAPSGFRVHEAAWTGAALLAVAGVWFATKEAARHALDTIGQERLQLWREDYLQLPIEAHHGD